MLYELLENDQGGPGSARQPLSATPAQARRRHPSFAAKRCCVSPAWVLGFPGLPWLLWLASAAPGMPQGGDERQAAAQCNPSPAQAQPRKLRAKREDVSLVRLWVPPVLAWLLLAAPEMPQARPKPRGEAPGATRAEPPK